MVHGFFGRIQVDSLPEQYQVSLMSIIDIINISSSVMSPYIMQFGINNHIDNIVLTHVVRFLFGTCVIFFITEQKL
jgi:hypothetical protein